MRLIKKGKTKDVYELPDGNYLLKLKDDATGKDGVFDPGENQVGLTIPGLGKKSLELTAYFYEKLNSMGFNTHFVSCDQNGASMTVKPAKMFGRGLEVICRLKAAGSFIRRYGDYVGEGEKLDYLVEFTLKDDAKNDPPASKETLVTLGVLTESEYEKLKGLAKEITVIIERELAAKGLDLYDIKYEFGKINGEIALADELSGGSVRIFHNGKIVPPMEINDYLFNK